MTIRVNKPSFNFREKLTKLERPIGTKGNQIAGAETTDDVRRLINAGRKNMIINGDMRISQRVGADVATVANGEYYIDRYRWDKGSGGGLSIQQVTDAPPGFSRSMKLTVTTADTGISTNEYFYFRQIIEGNNIGHLKWGTQYAKTVTLSFWVKSNVVGKHGGSLFNNDFNRSFPFDYEIREPNIWQHVSIVIPGCPDGTWLTGSGRGMSLVFCQQSGPGYTGIPGRWNSAGDIGPNNLVNLLHTGANTWYMTGLQLEESGVATEFEHRSYGEELALCQRYFYINGGGEHDIISQAFSPHTTEIAVAWPHPTEMRAEPTVTISSTNNNNTDFYFRTINNTGFSLTGNGRNISQMTKHHASIWFNGMSSVPNVPGQVRVQNDRTAFIHLSAEY
jgi:hypothetical protein